MIERVRILVVSLVFRTKLQKLVRLVEREEERGRSKERTRRQRRLHPLEANTKTQRVVSKHGGVTDETQER